MRAAGTTPDCSERLKRRQRIGAKSSAHSFNSHVNIGSVAHCLLSKPLTAAATSSGETGWKPGNTVNLDELWRCCVGSRRPDIGDLLVEEITKSDSRYAVKPVITIDH